MARKKRRVGRRGLRVGKWVNLGFKIGGLLVASGPMIKAVSDGVTSKDLPGIPKRIAFDYTGLDLNTGAWSSSQAVVGVGSILIGVALAKAGGYLGRMF